MKNQPLVAVVIVTYNRKLLLKEALTALIRQNYNNYFIQIIDNNSTDGTFEHIQNMLGDNVFYINTNENLGGAGGFNFGIKEANKYKPDYFWLMDDDCIVKEDSLSKLMIYAKQDIGFLSSKVLYTDGNLCAMNKQKKSLFKDVVDFNLNQEITFATFVSFLVSKKVVNELGLPIKEFFIWGDDLEYSSRISNKYKGYLIPESVVIHKTKSNIGSNITIDKVENLNRYFYAYRNEKYLYRKMGLKGRIFYILKIGYHRIKIILFSNNKRERLKIISKGLKEGKTFNPPIEYIEED